MSLTLMCVFAHPDDECFAAGGSIAHYAELGVKTVLVTTTGGEEGEISSPDLATPANLAAVRRQELEAAAKVLRIGKLLSLGYRDSGMAGTEANKDPRSLHAADPTEATKRLVALIERERPQVIVTHNERGDYGHPDHVKTHEITVAAFEALAYPAKLYIGAFPKSAMARMAQMMEQAGVESPFARDLKDAQGNPVELGTPDEMITTEVNVTAQAPLKREAMLKHATQFGPDHFMRTMPPEMFDRMWTTECFIQVGGERSEREGRETDLFAGLDHKG